MKDTTRRSSGLVTRPTISHSTPVLRHFEKSGGTSTLAVCRDRSVSISANRPEATRSEAISSAICCQLAASEVELSEDAGLAIANRFGAPLPLWQPEAEPERPQ